MDRLVKIKEAAPAENLVLPGELQPLEEVMVGFIGRHGAMTFEAVVPLKPMAPVPRSQWSQQHIVPRARMRVTPESPP